MGSFIFIAKICVIVFFGTIFVWNMVDLVASKSRGKFDSDLYFEKQMWMVICLLAIAVVLSEL